MNLNQIVNLVVRTVIMQTTRLLVNRAFGLFSRRSAVARVSAPTPEALPTEVATPVAAETLADPVAEARRLRRAAALARRAQP